MTVSPAARAWYLAGQRLREARLDAGGYTPELAARLLGVTLDELKRAEAGACDPAPMIARAEALGWSV